QSRIDLLDDVAVGEEAVDDFLQLTAGRQLFAGDAEVVGEPGGKVGVNRDGHTVGAGQREQILPDDRNDALLFDQLQELIPEDAGLGDGVPLACIVWLCAPGASAIDLVKSWPNSPPRSVVSRAW